MNILKMEEKERQKIQRIKNSGSDYQRIVYELISSSKFQNTIMGCVFVNILLMIMPTLPDDHGGVFFERLGNAMDFLDSVFLSVYVCEMILKSYVYHADYFHGWDLLDFFIVCVSLFDVGMAVKSSSTTSVAKGSNGGSAVKATKLLRVLRASRMLRVLRTLKFFDRLQRYIMTTIKAVKSLGPIFSIMFPSLCIFATVACSIFGEILPHRFGNILLTWFTLIQLITLDDWFEIIQEGSAQNGFLHLPLLFFIIIYIFGMVFIIFNLLIAVMVDNFQISIEENHAKENHKKAEVVSALDQLEAESDDDDESDDGQGFLDNLMNDDAKPKKVDMDEEDEFLDHFSNTPPSQQMLLQWYYRILPAIEKQMFNYNDQMSSYEKIIEEAIAQSDEMFTTR